MNTLTRIGAAVALATVLPLPACGTVAAEPTPPPAASARAHQNPLGLPKPTGPAAVGRDTLHLVDRHRADPWSPDRARELLVSLYYPATHPTGRTAPYLSTRESELLLAGLGREDQISAPTFSGTRTNAHPGARPAPGRHPLVVLSPGFTVHRSTLSGLAEELASRGYLVAIVDHAYESFGTTFPGDRTLPCLACDEIDASDDYAKVTNVRAEDTSFLLDRLTARGSRYAHLIDPRRIGMAGHSIGGAATARAMATDPRVRAGANLDGTLFAPIPESGLGRRPFLMLGAEELHTPGGVDDTWLRDYRRLDGWKRWLTAAGAGHYTFTDLPVLAGLLGLPEDPGYPLPGDRSGEITRDYVAAFFDAHLRGIPQPLLAGPSPANPEVTFHRP